MTSDICLCEIPFTGMDSSCKVCARERRIKEIKSIKRAQKRRSANFKKLLNPELTGGAR